MAVITILNRIDDTKARPSDALCAEIDAVLSKLAHQDCASFMLEQTTQPLDL